jgi:DNA primase
MAGKIPDDTLQAIRERVSIVEVVSGYVSLKKAGRNHLGLCPFHSEKTPSFTVSDERGLFHCFGCGAGGTVFTFVMRADHVDFVEAVEVLARRAGVTLPQRADTSAGGEHRQELVRLNEIAQRCFREALQAPGGAVARLYLEKRGVTQATVDGYGLGFCPPNGSGLTRALAAKPVAVQKAIDVGLLGRRANGTAYDRFWGRVTFPIRDGSGRILGFGGRTLGSEHPKYLNSPESTLFHKGQVLYGLYEARQAVREAERVVIVEGYLDALALVEAGIGYAVASLGTALSPAQLRLARRFAPEVVVFFDGDRAGQDAAVRAFGVCAETGVWGLGAFLPQGFDPDTFVRDRGVEATRALLQQAVPLADFFLQRVDPGPGATVPQRVRAAQRVREVIAHVQDSTQFQMLAKQAAQRLGVDESLFREPRAARQMPVTAKTAATDGTAVAVFPAEEAKLVEAMALDRNVAVLVSQRGVLGSFRSPELAEAGRAVIAAWEATGSSASVVDQLPVPLPQRVTAGLLGEGAMATGDRLGEVRESISRIERVVQSRRVRELLVQVNDGGRSDDELRRLKEAVERRKEIGHG